MKLSKKFKERYSEFTALYDQECLEIIEQYELQPDDIEGCVILTLDEAKALLRRIPEFKENGDWQLPIERLKERIAKTEGK